LEARIGESEEELARLEKSMADPDFFADGARARKGAREHETLTALIADLYDEWEKIHGDTAMQ
jgi:hypothetical protein